ncbi:MAG TPA: alanine racemase, partial [Solirubrobacteraceae bacterium]|nr:alanine racemase [Solirubrobacteraceae bacterium]
MSAQPRSATQRPAPAPAADGAGDAEASYARLERACAGLEAPFALVDLDAMWSNAADMHRRAAGKPIRLASKSVRCRALQERVLERPGFRGTFAFTLPEALWLAAHGVRDILVAYPSTDRHALTELASSAELGQAGARVTVMVDCVEHLDMIERARSGFPAAAVRVCIDIDTGWRALRWRVRVGAKRSPLHYPA